MTADGFVQYAIEDQGRCGSSSSTRSRRGGTAAASARPAPPGFAPGSRRRPDRPTLIVLHHPPIETGLSWMTREWRPPWIMRLWEVVAEAENVVALIAGHLHRPV
jgi:Icc protein